MKLLFFGISLTLFLSFNANAIERLTDDEISQHEVFYKAEKARKSADFRAAIKLYKYAYSEKLNRPVALKGLVSTYLEADDNFAAQQFLIKDIEKNEFDVEARILLINVYLDSDSFKEAEQQIKIAKNIAPSDWRLKALSGNSYLLQSKYADAIAAYSECLDTKDCSSEAVFHRGLAFYNLKQSDRAYADFKSVYSSHSNQLELLIPYISVMHSMNKYDESLAVIQKCQSVDSTRPECWSLLGHYYVKQNNLVTAAQNFEKAVKLAPYNFEMRKILAGSLVQIGRSADADVQFEKALSLKPGDIEVLRAWVTSLKARSMQSKISSVLQQHYNQKIPNLWAAQELAHAYSIIDKKQNALDVMESARDKLKTVDADIYYSYFLVQADEFSDALKVMNRSKIEQDRKNYYLSLIKSLENKSEKRNVSSQDSQVPDKVNSITDWNLPKL
ncbi:MAG: tetratricopeptide repeat protein [Bdellovibrionota bacterium]